MRVLRDASVTGAAATLNAKAFTHAGDVYMPAHHGPLDRGPGRALLAHELTHVQQQRDLGSALPPEHTPEGQRLERAAQSAEQTGSLPLNLPLATVPAPRRSRATAVAQRSAERGAHLHDETETEATDAGPQYTPGTTGLSPGPTAAVQREPNSSTGSSALATAATAAAANATPQGFGTSAEQLDELASKLWDRLRHRLRRELLNERERAGMVADVRY